MKLLFTDKGEQDGQEDKAVSGANQHNSQVHPEIEDLENLRLGKGQNDDASEFGQSNARQDLQLTKRKKKNKGNK